jgi:hypothetical protein
MSRQMKRPNHFTSPIKQVLRIQISGYGLPGDAQIEQIQHDLTQNPQVDLIVFDKSLGPENQEENYINLLKQLKFNQDFLLTTSNYRYFQSGHPQIMYYPEYLFDVRYSHNLIQYNIEQSRQYKLSCLTRNPWTHKTMNFLTMKKQSWWDQCVVSFGLDANETYQIDPINADVCLFADQEEIDWLRSVYPVILPFPDNRRKHPSNNCATYGNCYLDYAVESSIENCFVSEKSWKPIFSGQLFFLFGGPGIIEHFRQMGIDTFDDILDHSYDTVIDNKDRMNSIMQSISKYMSLDLDSVWKSTYLRRKKNLDLVYNPDFYDFVLSDLNSRLI